MRCTWGLKHLPHLLRSYHVIMCHGKEIEQIVAGSYVRPRRLTDVARPDVLHPGAAGVTEAHLQASRLLCLSSNPQFTTAKHKVARANSGEPTAVQRCHQPCVRCHNSSETAASLHSAESRSYSPNPSIHKCTVSHREINLQSNCCVLIFWINSYEVDLGTNAKC